MVSAISAVAGQPAVAADSAVGRASRSLWALQLNGNTLAGPMRDWIRDQNLRAWLEIVAAEFAYDFDPDDWNAVQAGLPDTDVERDCWFDYPLGPATVRVALDPGSSVVFVALDGSGELAARTAMATAIAQTYLLTR